MEVAIISVKKLVQKYKINHIHLLAVDAEGLDHHIILSTLNEGIVPDVLYFESQHIDNKMSFYQKLATWGYQAYEYKSDTIAVNEKYRSLLP